ncbi:hypothetical protein [Picosynechococcus sp. PCC 73109]|uniref:hypothetical protein n=1 Tax=Picosynechococcus sp. PCC 73109 TaxID=374982 RepID=UPI000A529D7B|nr:hypothetical protein [Picosynechococcus sp. PCC 73109]
MNRKRLNDFRYFCLEMHHRSYWHDSALYWVGLANLATQYLRPSPIVRLYPDLFINPEETARLVATMKTYGF